LAPKQATAIYCATKAGLHSASQTLRWQLEDSTVSVFEVLPPFVSTAMTAHRGRGGMTPERLAQVFWSDFVLDRYEMPIGATRWLKLLLRLAPGWATAKVRHRV
ncbi:MAG: SDR family NAD(P)-dependent oxidoreductase, partial [Rhodoferax sp.]